MIEKCDEVCAAPNGEGRFALWVGKSRGILLGLLFGFYFGGLGLGAAHFPHGYDWRRNVISNLLSPRDNPGWYGAPVLGVAMAGLCMMALMVWIERELGDGGRVRKGAFFFGIGCLILSAVVAPQHRHLVMGIRHSHEALARIAAVGLGVGMVCACRSRALNEAVGGEREGRLRRLRMVWWAATAPALAGAIGSGLIVGAARLHFLGAGTVQLFKGTVFWHLSFWEWAGSGAVFLFFAGAVAMLGRD